MTDHTRPRARRTYASTLRAEQAVQTRRRILAALAARLARGGGGETMAEVAREAGVSLRTLHHHFPNEAGRIEALARWIDTETGVSDEAPAGPEDLVPYARRMMRAFFAHELLFRALLAPGVAAQVRRERRQRRESAVRAAVGRLTAGAGADRAAAVISALIGAPTAVHMVDHHGLSPAATEAALAWAVRVLTEAAARGDTAELSLRPPSPGAAGRR